MSAQRISSSDADGSVLVHSDDESSIVERDVPHGSMGLGGSGSYSPAPPLDLHRGAGGRGGAGLGRVWDTRHAAAAARGQQPRLAALPPVHGAEWAPPVPRQHRSVDTAGGGRGGGAAGALNLGDSIDGFPVFVDEDGVMKMHPPRRRGPFDFAYGAADEEASHLLGGAGTGGGGGGGGAGRARGYRAGSRSYGGGADDVVLNSSVTSSEGSVLSGSLSSSFSSYSSHEGRYRQPQRDSGRGYSSQLPQYSQQPHGAHGSHYGPVSLDLYYPAERSNPFSEDGVGSGGGGLLRFGAGLPGRPHVASRRRRLVGAGATSGTTAAGASALGRRGKGRRWKGGSRRPGKQAGSGGGSGGGGTAVVPSGVVTGFPFASGAYYDPSSTSRVVGCLSTSGSFPFNSWPLVNTLGGVSAAKTATVAAAVAAIPGGLSAFLLLSAGIPRSVGPSAAEKAARTRDYLLARQAELEQRHEARRRTGAAGKEAAKRAAPSSPLASPRLADSGSTSHANASAAGAAASHLVRGGRPTVALPVSLEDLSRSMGGPLTGSTALGATLMLATARSVRSRGREATSATVAAAGAPESRTSPGYGRVDQSSRNQYQEVGAAASALMEEQPPVVVLRDPYTGLAVSPAYVKTARSPRGGEAASAAAATPHTCSAGIHFFRDPSVPRPSVLSLVAPPPSWSRSVASPLTSMAYAFGSSQAVSEGNSLRASFCTPHTPPLLRNTAAGPAVAAATATAAAATYQLPSSLQLHSGSLLPVVPLPVPPREGSIESRSVRSATGSRGAAVSARLGASSAAGSDGQDSARHPRTETAAFRDGRTDLTGRDTSGALPHDSAPSLGTLGFGGAARSRWRLQQGSAAGASAMSQTSPRSAASVGGGGGGVRPPALPSVAIGVDMSASANGSATMPSSVAWPRAAPSLPVPAVLLPAYPPAIAPYAAPRPPQLQNTRYHAWTAEGVSTTSNTPCVVHVFTVSAAMLRSVYEYVAYMCVAKRHAELQRRQRRRGERAVAELVAGRLSREVQRCLRCPHCGAVGQVVRRPTPRRGSTALAPPLQLTSPSTAAATTAALTQQQQQQQQQLPQHHHHHLTQPPPHRHSRVHSQPHPHLQHHNPHHQHRRHSEHHSRASLRLSSTSTLNALPLQPLRGSTSAASLSTDAPVTQQQHTERLGWPPALLTTTSAHARTSLPPQAPPRSSLAMSGTSHGSSSGGVAGAGEETRTEDFMLLAASWSRGPLNLASSTASLGGGGGGGGVAVQPVCDASGAGGSAPAPHAPPLPTHPVAPANSSFADEPYDAATALLSPPPGPGIRSTTTTATTAASRAPPLVTRGAAGQPTSPALPPLARSGLPPALRAPPTAVLQPSERADELLGQEPQGPFVTMNFLFPSIGEPATAAAAASTTASATSPKVRRRVRSLGASTADAAALLSAAGAPNGGGDGGDGSGDAVLESPTRSTELSRSLPMSSVVRMSASQTALDRYASASGTDVRAPRRLTATAAATALQRGADVLSPVDDAGVAGAWPAPRGTDDVAGGDDPVDYSLPRLREAVRRSSSNSLRGGAGGGFIGGGAGSDVDEARRARAGSLVGANSASSASQQQLPPHAALGDSFAEMLISPPSLPIAIPTTTSPDRSTVTLMAACRRDAAAAALAAGHTGTAAPPPSSSVARRASSVATAMRATGTLTAVGPAGSSPAVQTRGLGNSVRSMPNAPSGINSLFCSVAAAALTPAMPPLAQSGVPSHGDRENPEETHAIEGAAGEGQGAAGESGRDGGDGLYVCLGCHRHVAPHGSLLVSLSDLHHHRHAHHHHSHAHGPPPSPPAAAANHGAGDAKGTDTADPAAIGVIAFEDLMQDDAMVHALHTCLRDALMLPTTCDPPPAPSPLRRGSSHVPFAQQRRRLSQRRASSVPMPAHRNLHELLQPIIATAPPAAEPHATRACSSLPPPEPHALAADAERAETAAAVAAPNTERGTRPGGGAVKVEGAVDTAAAQGDVPAFPLSIFGASSSSSCASPGDDASSSSSSSSPSASPTSSTTSSSAASAGVDAAASRGPRKSGARGGGVGDGAGHSARGDDVFGSSGPPGGGAAGPRHPLQRLSLPCCGLTVTALPYVAPQVPPLAGWTREGRDSAADARHAARDEKWRGDSQPAVVAAAAAAGGDGGGGGAANATTRRPPRRRSFSTTSRTCSPVPRMREDAATRGLTPSAVLMSDVAPQRRRRSSASAAQGPAARDGRSSQPPMQQPRRGLADRTAALAHSASDAMLQDHTATTIALMMKSTLSSEKHRIQVNPRTPLDAVSKNRIMDRIFRQDRLGGVPAVATARSPLGERHAGLGPRRGEAAAEAQPPASAAAGPSRWAKPGSLPQVGPEGAGGDSAELLAGRQAQASAAAQHGVHDGGLRGAPSHARAVALRLLPPDRTPAPLGLDLGAYEDASLVLEVDLAYPRVPGGNVRELLAEWKEACRPHPVLVEAVLRNIVFSVLVQLADLHAAGRTHGSVKSTNVFPLWNAVEGTRQAGVVLPPRPRHRPAPLATSTSQSPVVPPGRATTASDTPDGRDDDTQPPRLSAFQFAWGEDSSEQPAGASAGAAQVDDATPRSTRPSAAAPGSAAGTQVPGAAVAAADSGAGSSAKKRRPQTGSTERRHSTRASAAHVRAHQDTRRQAGKSSGAAAIAAQPPARSGSLSAPLPSMTTAAAAFAGSRAGANGTTTTTTGLATAMAAFRRGSAAAGAPLACMLPPRLMSLSSTESPAGVLLPAVRTPVAEPQTPLLTSDSLVVQRGACSGSNTAPFSPAVGLSSSNPRRRRRGSGATVSGTASVTAAMGAGAGGGAEGRRRLRRGSLGTNIGGDSRTGDRSDDSEADEDAALVPLVAEVLTPPGALQRRRSGAARPLAEPMGGAALPAPMAAQTRPHARRAGVPAHGLGRRTVVPAGLEDPDEWLVAAVRRRYARGVQLRSAGAVWFATAACGGADTDADRSSALAVAATGEDGEAKRACASAAAPAQPVLTTGPTGAVPGPRPGCCLCVDDAAGPPTDALQWSRQVLLVESVGAVVATALRTAMTCVLMQHPPRPAPVPAASPAAAASKKGRPSASARHKGSAAQSPAAPSRSVYVPDVQHASPPPPPCLFDVQESEYVPAPEQIRTGADEAQALLRLWQQQRPEEPASGIGISGCNNVGSAVAGGAEWLTQDDLSGSPATTLRNTLDPYPVQTATADIWALGMMALELADGPAPTTWLKQRDLAPALRPYPWSSFFHAFVACCLQRAPEQRATAVELLDHAWFGVALMPQAASVPAPLDGTGGWRRGSAGEAAAAAAAAAAPPPPLPPRAPGVMGVDSLTAEEKAEWEGYDYTQLYAAATHASRPRTTSAVAPAAAAAGGATTPSIASAGDVRATAGGRGGHIRAHVTTLSVTSADALTGGGAGAVPATEHGHATAGDVQSILAVSRRSADHMSFSHITAGTGAGPLPTALASVVDGTSGRAGAGSGSTAASAMNASAYDDNDVMAELCAVDMAQHFAQQVTAQWVRQQQQFMPSLAAAAGSLPLSAASQRDPAAAPDGATPLLQPITSARSSGGVGVALSPWYGTAPSLHHQFSDFFTTPGIREDRAAPFYANHSMTFSNNASMTSQALLSHLKSAGSSAPSPVPGAPSEVTGRGTLTWTGVPSSLVPTLYVPLRDPRDDTGIARQPSAASTPPTGGASGGSASPWLPRGASDWSGGVSPLQVPPSSSAMGRGAAAAAAAAGHAGNPAVFPVLERDGRCASSEGSEGKWAERVAGMGRAAHSSRCRSSGSAGEGKEDSTDTGSTRSSGRDSDRIFSSTSSSRGSEASSVASSTAMANGRGGRHGRQRGTALPGSQRTSGASLSYMGGPAVTGGEVPDPTRTRAPHVSGVLSTTSSLRRDSDAVSLSSAALFKIQTPEHSRGEASPPRGQSPPLTGATRPRARLGSRHPWQEDAADAATAMAAAAPLSACPHGGRRHVLLGTIATSLARLSMMVHTHSSATRRNRTDSSSTSSESTPTSTSSSGRTSSGSDDEDYDSDTETTPSLAERRSSWQRMSHRESDATLARGAISDDDGDDAAAPHTHAAAHGRDEDDGAGSPRMSAEVRCDEIAHCFAALQRTCPAAVSLWAARMLQQAARQPRTTITAARLLQRVEQALPTNRPRRLAWLTAPDASPSPVPPSCTSGALTAAGVASPTSPTAAVPSVSWRPTGALAALPPPELDASPSSFHNYETAKWLYALHQTLPRCT